MQPEYLIVLFSKYSSVCQSLLELYDEQSMNTIKFICIDHSTIRKRVLEDKILQVKQVPCVLFVYPQNRIEKFEGSNVTKWLSEKLLQLQPQQQPQPFVPQSQQPQPQLVQKTQQQPFVPQTQTQQPQMTEEVAEPFVTSIEDLTGEEDDEFVKQSVSGSSVIDNIVNNSVNKSVKKQKSIVERAAEMAAMREGADKPAHLQMQEQQHRQLDAAINGSYQSV